MKAKTQEKRERKTICGCRIYRLTCWDWYQVQAQKRPHISSGGNYPLPQRNSLFGAWRHTTLLAKDSDDSNCSERT